MVRIAVIIVLLSLFLSAVVAYYIGRKWSMVLYFQGIGYDQVRVVDKEGKVYRGWSYRRDIDRVFPGMNINISDVVRVFMEGNSRVVVPLGEMQKFEVLKNTVVIVMTAKKTYL